MKANEHTALVGDAVVLVPYRPHHVTKYHEWMQDNDLRELTASDPLTLDEEYEMQRKWQVDDDKLTFIILARDGPRDAPPAIARLPMIGDANLFLKGARTADDFEAEVEIMIAEPAFRRRGLARRALQLLLAYATAAHAPAPLPVPAPALVARVGARNAPSIALFESLGFVVVKHVSVFAEVEMRLVDADAARAGWVAGEEVEC